MLSRIRHVAVDPNVVGTVGDHHLGPLIAEQCREARPEPRVSTNDPVITEHPSITDLRNCRPRPVRLDWFVFIAGREPVDHDLDIIEAEPRRREIELWIEQFDRLVLQGE